MLSMHAKLRIRKGLYAEKLRFPKGAYNVDVNWFRIRYRPLERHYSIVKDRFLGDLDVLRHPFASG